MGSTVTPFSAERLLDLDALSQTALGRFRTSGDLFDIDEAISAQKQAIAHTAKADTKQLATRLRALATACSIRFSASKHILDIRQSVSCLQIAQTICDSGLSNSIAGEFAEALTEFGICLIQRARSQGKVEDLGHAIDVLRRAVDTPGSWDPATMSRRLGALGIALKRRFQRYQDPEDIHQSVRVLRQDCNLKDRSTETTITNRAVGFYNLAASLSERYQTLGDPQDLLEAIEFFRTTVKIAPSTDPNRSTYLLEFGGNLNLLFEATGDSGAVSESIEVLLEALS
jgi:tetratricopeptide (TPR) repeat protein